MKVKSVQQLIRLIPFRVSIDTIHLKNAAIIYEEVPLGSDQAGKIIFNDIQGSIFNFSNDTLLADFPIMKINISSKIMNEGKLQVHFRFPLNTQKTIFDCSGKLDDFPLKTINPILVNNENIFIKNGMVDSLLFSFHADNNSSNGRLRFVYHDLKMEILGKNKKSGIIQDLISVITHRFIIKENNPTGKKPVRMTRISYPYNPGKFFLNYTWKSILSGIKPAIGLTHTKSKGEESETNNKK